MIPEDQQRVIISLLLSIPLSYALRFIPSRTYKQTYSFLLGTALQLYVYQSGLPYVFGLHILVYYLTLMYPKNCGAIVTITTLLLLSIYHIYRMIVDYESWNLDISTVLMTMVCKYSLYAYSVQDGRTNPEKLTKEQIFHRIEHVPSLLQYLGYCQFLPTAIIGTAVDFKIYDHYITSKEDFKSIPPPWKKIGQDLGYSAILAALYILGQVFYPLKAMQAYQFPFEHSCAYLIYFCFVSVTLIRFKYYFAWKFSLGAVHASGISYQTHSNGNSDFDRIQTCNPHIVETTMHVRVKIANWNMTAQEWLRRCIYERSPYHSKSKNQLLTFLVSSFWHGFYGGYYLGFFLWFSQTHLHQLIFNETKRQKSFYVAYYKKTGIVGKVLLWIGANLLFSFSGTFFLILSLKQGLRILYATYFISLIVIFGLIALFTFFPGGKKVKKKVEVDEQKERLVNKLSGLDEAKKLLEEQKKEIEERIKEIEEKKENIQLQQEKKIR